VDFRFLPIELGERSRDRGALEPDLGQIAGREAARRHYGALFSAGDVDAVEEAPREAPQQLVLAPEARDVALGLPESGDERRVLGPQPRLALCEARLEDVALLLPIDGVFGGRRLRKRTQSVRPPVPRTNNGSLNAHHLLSDP